jgi:hypothetical protein
MFSPLRNIYEPLFIRYSVSLVFNGHDHNYQRTYPMNNYKRDTCGPVHIVLGNGERAGWALQSAMHCWITCILGPRSRRLDATHGTPCHACRLVTCYGQSLALAHV